MEASRAGIENRIRFDAAVHEAGHAVVGLALGLDLSAVLIRPDGTGCASWHLANPPETPDETRGDQEPAPTAPTDRAAGLDVMRENPAVFESLLAGLRNALGSPEGIVAHLTMVRSGREAQLRVGCPLELAEGVAADDEITEDLLLASFSEREFYRADGLTRARAVSLVKAHWQEIVAVACVLMERGRLSGDEVRRLLKGANVD